MILWVLDIFKLLIKWLGEEINVHKQNNFAKYVSNFLESFYFPSKLSILTM